MFFYDSVVMLSNIRYFILLNIFFKTRSRETATNYMTLL